jgi:hypothetical protein
MRALRAADMGDAMADRQSILDPARGEVKRRDKRRVEKEKKETPLKQWHDTRECPESYFVIAKSLIGQWELPGPRVEDLVESAVLRSHPHDAPVETPHSFDRTKPHRMTLTSSGFSSLLSALV